ncbi:hypothetical protein UFOVP386_43 [uncultured Caudovirales phage]|uniref:Uncharacterized protein n=1 Tax=uncultured Caudovirales phage TaxID=2100421 RepID=A0A6J7X1F9_9CAUD|nr:hypothetical protein UFOVP386_43 [uncultured Caudovirales phage]
MSSITTLSIYDVPMEIEYDISHEPGYLHDSDGHGLPSSTDIDILGIFIGEVDITELIILGAPGIKDYIIESIIEKESY